MLTNREIRSQAHHLQKCLEGYILAIENYANGDDAKLDKKAELYEPFYTEMVAEIGKFLAMFGKVDPGE